MSTNQSKRKFYRTDFTVTVLSEGPVADGLSLEALASGILEGDCIGIVEQGESQLLAPLAVVRLLEEEGDSPTVFQLNDKGEDL